jgi:O-antigen/teichoic acid export membrane protein
MGLDQGCRQDPLTANRRRGYKRREIPVKVLAKAGAVTVENASPADNITCCEASPETLNHGNRIVQQIRAHARMFLGAAVASQLRRNVASGVVAALINAVAALVSYPIYAHFLGLETYGTWLVLSTLMQLALLGDLGVSHALTKLVAEAHGEHNRADVCRYISAALVVLAVSGTVILAVTLTAASWVLSFFDLSAENLSIVQRLLPYVGLLTVYALLCQVYCSALSGLGRMDAANYIHSVGRALGIILASLLVVAGAGMPALLIGAAATCVIQHAAFAWILGRQEGIGHGLGMRPGRRHIVRILGFGGGMLSATLMHQVLGPFNKLLLCKSCGVASVPIYEIAIGSAQQLRSLAEAGLRALMPEVSRIGNNSVDAVCRIRRLNKRALKLILIFSSPCYFVVLVATKPLLELWIGEPLAVQLAPVLAVILLGNYVNLISVPAYYTLIGLGQVRTIFRASVIYVGTNAVIASLLFAGGYLTPTAVAWCVTMALIATSLNLLYSSTNLLAASELRAEVPGSHRAHEETGRSTPAHSTCTS